MVNLRVLALSAVILMGSWGVARADFCITDTDFNTVVGKNFSLPGKGACRDFTGFQDRVVSTVKGTACASSDNTRITFSLTRNYPTAEYFFIDAFVLNRATLSGSGRRCFYTESGNICSPESFTKIPCVPAAVPVP
jgi:hypothetical protein